MSGQRLRAGLHDAFHRPDSPIGRRVDAIVWALILASVASLALTELVPDAWGARPALERLDRALLALFALEIALRVLSYHPPGLDFWQLGPAERLRAHVTGRLRFLLTPLLLFDLVTVFGSVPALRGLRALRLLRLLRTRRILRYSNPFEALERAFQENGVLYGFGVTVFLGAVALGGLSFYLSEREANPEIASLPDAMWWSIVTLTTVGYGDLTPVTGVGRAVGAALMVAGMVTLALFAGIVSASLMGAVLSMREESFRMSQYIGHVVVCGYEPGTRLLLDALAAEIELEKHDVVLFGDTERPPELPPSFRWVRGDPTKESELDKARIAYASSVLVVGARSELPQLADARTILVVFTLRRYLRQRADQARRQQPLHIVAEILDTENVEHARAAGADEVIETTRLGFSLLAHAIEVRGTSALVAEIADASGHSLFVGRLPDDLGAIAFGEASRAVKQRYGALLVGVRDGEIDELNPPDERPLPAGAKVVYLAQQPVLPT